MRSFSPKLAEPTAFEPIVRLQVTVLALKEVKTGNFLSKKQVGAEKKRWEEEEKEELV